MSGMQAICVRSISSIYEIELHFIADGRFEHNNLFSKPMPRCTNVDTFSGQTTLAARALFRIAFVEFPFDAISLWHRIGKTSNSVSAIGNNQSRIQETDSQLIPLRLTLSNISIFLRISRLEETNLEFHIYLTLLMAMLLTAVMRSAGKTNRTRFTAKCIRWALFALSHVPNGTSHKITIKSIWHAQEQKRVTSEQTRKVCVRAMRTCPAWCSLRVHIYSTNLCVFVWTTSSGIAQLNAFSSLILRTFLSQFFLSICANYDASWLRIAAKAHERKANWRTNPHSFTIYSTITYERAAHECVMGLLIGFCRHFFSFIAREFHVAAMWRWEISTHHTHTHIRYGDAVNCSSKLPEAVHLHRLALAHPHL